MQNISGDLDFFLRNKKFSGRNYIKKLLILKEYFGLSKIDLFDGVMIAQLTIRELSLNNDFEKLINSISSKEIVNRKNKSKWCRFCSNCKDS